MEYIHILQIFPKIGSFIGAEDTKGKVEQSPQVNGFPCVAVDFGHIMNLGMAVVARRNAIGCLGGQNLIGLGLAVRPSLLGESRLKVSATAAAAEVIGTIGGHVNEVFFPDNGLYHIAHVLGNRISQGLSDQLTGILKRELDLAFFVPVRGGL